MVDENKGKEWWQPSEKMPAISNTPGHYSENITDPTVTSKAPRVYGQTPTNGINRARGISGVNGASSTNSMPDTVHKPPSSQREDLPSWLTEQPTRADMSMLRPSTLSNTAKIPSSPIPEPPLAEWQPATPLPQAKTTDQLPLKQSTGPQKTVTKSGDMGNRRTSSPEWQPPTPSSPMQSLAQPRRTSDALALNRQQESGPLSSSIGASGASRVQKRNYPALVAALQTLGYSIPGFVAAAVVNLDGQPIAQVAVDELDIASMCGYFSTMLRGVLLSLEHGKWGKCEDVVISSTERHILLRIVGEGAFQVLITSRASDPGESLKVMANVESAIAVAL